MKKTITYYSDCHFFAGCENMLANFFNSTELKEKYNINFVYRDSAAYTEGLNKRVTVVDFNIFPVRIWDSNLHFMQVKHSKNKYIDGIRKFIVGLLIIFFRYLFVFMNIFICYNVFRKTKTDILHVNNGGYPGAYSCMSAIFAARLCGISNIVYVVNNIAVPYSNPSRWFDILLDKLITKSVTLFVTGSNYAGTHLRSVLSLPDNQIMNIHNGIKSRIITETPDQVYERLKLGNVSGRVLFGVVAVHEKRKGHIYLLEAMQQLKNNNFINKKPLICIEGRGTESGKLKEFVSRNKLDDYVVFTGDEDNVFNFMNSMDVIILPSVESEDFPNVVTEAMSLGKAVIASSFAGIPEQIDNMGNGILVEPGDSTRLSQAIKLLCDNEDLISGMGEHGRKKFQDVFTESVSVRRYIAMYDKITEKFH